MRGRDRETERERERERERKRKDRVLWRTMKPLQDLTKHMEIEQHNQNKMSNL